MAQEKWLVEEPKVIDTGIFSSTRSTTEISR